MPDLRIFDQNLWDALKRRQEQLGLGTLPGDNRILNERRWPKHQFTGLIKCGRCGSYPMISKEMVGCTNAPTKGTCDTRLDIHRDTFEQSVLNGLDKLLMEPDLCKECRDEFTREFNARMRLASLDPWATERRRDRELHTLLDLATISWGLDKREHRWPPSSARWSTATSLSPIRRNW